MVNNNKDDKSASNKKDPADKQKTIDQKTIDALLKEAEVDYVLHSNQVADELGPNVSPSPVGFGSTHMYRFKKLSSDISKSKKIIQVVLIILFILFLISDWFFNY